jgi:hypothetical protein
MRPASFERDITILLIGILVGSLMTIGWTWP